MGMTTKEILQGVHDWTSQKVVYDISAAHPDGQGNPTPYVDLTAALGLNGGNIPQGLRKGGMSVKFIQGTVQGSDNKYVQFRYMSSSTATGDFTNVANWQGVDDEPVAGSENLVKSGGVSKLGSNILLVGKGDIGVSCNLNYVKPGATYIISLNHTWTAPSQTQYFEISYKDNTGNHELAKANANPIQIIPLENKYIVSIPSTVEGLIYLQVWAKIPLGEKVYFSILESTDDVIGYLFNQIEKKGNIANVRLYGSSYKNLYIEDEEVYSISVPYSWNLPSPTPSYVFFISKKPVGSPIEDLVVVSNFADLKSMYLIKGSSNVEYFQIGVKAADDTFVPVKMSSIDIRQNFLTEEFGGIKGFVGSNISLNGLGTYNRTQNQIIPSNRLRYALVPCKTGDYIYLEGVTDFVILNSNLEDISEYINKTFLYKYTFADDGYIFAEGYGENNPRVVKLASYDSNIIDFASFAPTLFSFANYYISKSTGARTPSTGGYYATANIPTFGFPKIKVTVQVQPNSESSAALAFYDINGTFISAVQYVDETLEVPTAQVKTIDVPAQAAFFATCLKQADVSSAIVELFNYIDTKVPMMFGRTDNGIIIKGSSTERWERSYSKLIKVEGRIVEIPSERSARMCLYDSNFNYIKYSQNISEINNAAYIRCIANEIGNTYHPDDFIIKHTGVIEYVNEPNRAVNAFNPNWFTVDVALPLDNPTTAWVEREKLYTNAWISLPWNYTPNGKKSKLIVYGTGTSGAKWDTISDGTDEKVNFFNAMGYAVIVVNANTSKYNAYRRNNAATPLGVACFVAAVKYVVENYNIDNEIYLYGKSDGGMTTMNLINTSNLNIKAAAIHCPNLDVFNEFRCMNLTTNSQQGQLSQFNMVVSQDSGSWLAADIAELKTKQDNFDGYNPMTLKCTINKKEYDDYVLDHDYPMASSLYPNSVMKDYSDTYLMGADMQNIIKDAKLFLNSPVKIWYADDDPQVPYGTIVNFAKMASNAGCVCKLRKFADGTGGHYCADAWSQSTAAGANLAPRVDIQTRYGGVMNMPLGMVEALQWLELW